MAPLHWSGFFRRGLVWLAAAALVAAAFVFVFFVLPAVIVAEGDAPTAAARTKLQNEVRSAGAQFLGGLVLALGLFFTARTLQVNREGQITERFSKAIEQLGEKRLDVRLGGIYALERIARDSKRDHWPVMELLSEYVRRYERTSRDPPNRAPPDIQAIVDVLGRRNVRYDARARLRLEGADLRQVSIRNGNFDFAWLEKADLRSATISEKSSFREAVLFDADLRAAQVYDSSLREAGSIGVKLERAVFGGADLRGIALMGVDLSRVTFLDPSDLTGAVYDEDTVWPDGFDPQASGAEEVPWAAARRNSRGSSEGGSAGRTPS